MVDKSEQEEIISDIDRCRRCLIRMLDDGHMTEELKEEDKAKVNQVIEYLNLYKNVVRARYKTN